MILAGILLLISAFLCVLSIILKSIRQKNLRNAIIVFQGFISLLIFLWSLSYLIILNFFKSEQIIQNPGLVFFLTLLFSYIITLTVSFLLAVTFIQKLSEFYAKTKDTQIKYREWYSKLIKIQVPLSLLCFIIGVWDIIYVTSVHSLIINMIELS